MNTKLLEFLKKDLISKNVDVNQSLVNLVKNHRKLYYIKKIKLFPYPDLKECKKYIVEYYKITKPKNNKSSKIQTVKVQTVKIDYYKYIKSLEWKNLRSKFLIYKGNKCEKCFSKTNLNVHHLHYKTLGKESFKDLMLLCRDCHKIEHGIGTSEKDIMNFIKSFV